MFSYYTQNIHKYWNTAYYFIFAVFLLSIIINCVMFGVDTMNNSSFYAAINIPFDSADAGLTVVPSGDDIVSESAPDAGADLMVNILVTVFHTMKWVLGFFAFLWVVVSGFYMVTNGRSEDDAKSAKKMMQYSIAGLVAMLLVEPLVLDVFWGGGSGGISSQEDFSIDRLKAMSDNFQIQVHGILEFVKTLLVFVAMAYVMLAGIKMMASFGDDEQISSAKSMFFPIALGLLVIAFNEVFVDEILYNWVLDGDEVRFSPDADNANAFVAQIVGFVQYILQFIGILVFGLMVYGGFLYILSMGEDDKASEGKTIFINAFIGMVILMFSYVLMASLVNFSLV